MDYSIYRWRYKAKRGVTMVIFARERKTADEIIAVENRKNIYFYRPARFFFRVLVATSIPPYELEQDQLHAAEKRLGYRKVNIKRICD